ncbi:MAG: helix-turn-helix domain-containing protein [Desulfurococcales archaeon]|nr:helix-turn-helix domain-containing protein [Desulfurococcales archaeon]
MARGAGESLEGFEGFDYAAKMVAVRIAGDIVLSPNPGAALRRWREYFEVRQSEIARIMGVFTSVISDYEKGRRVPGARFIKRFVAALIEVDRRRDWKKIRHLAPLVGTVPGAIVDMAEFAKPVTASIVSGALEGVMLGYRDPERLVYGYTVIDSIKAILNLSGLQFTVLFGLNPQRAMVFTGSQYGRSPMVAVRTSPIKPAVVVVQIRGGKVDPLAEELAKRDAIPLIAVDESVDVVERLRGLARRVEDEVIRQSSPPSALE